MLKKEATASSKTAIGLKCGDCLHFKDVAKFDKPCQFLSIQAHAKAPSCYAPNVYKLVFNNDAEAHHKLGILIKDFDPSQMRMLAAIFAQQAKIKKRYRLSYGQPVYFCFGSDYLSNYFKGYFINGSVDGEDSVYVASSLNRQQRKKPLVASLMRDSVFTLTEFEKKKRSLIKDDRLVDPKPLFGTNKVNPKDLDDYEVPTMEKAPKEWYDKIDKKKPKAKKSFVKAVNGSLKFTVNRAGD